MLLQLYIIKINLVCLSLTYFYFLIQFYNFFFAATHFFFFVDYKVNFKSLNRRITDILKILLPVGSPLKSYTLFMPCLISNIQLTTSLTFCYLIFCYLILIKITKTDIWSEMKLNIHDISFNADLSCGGKFMLLIFYFCILVLLFILFPDNFIMNCIFLFLLLNLGLLFSLKYHSKTSQLLLLTNTEQRVKEILHICSLIITFFFMFGIIFIIPKGAGYDGPAPYFLFLILKHYIRLIIVLIAALFTYYLMVEPTDARFLWGWFNYAIVLPMLYLALLDIARLALAIYTYKNSFLTIDQIQILQTYYETVIFIYLLSIMHFQLKYTVLNKIIPAFLLTYIHTRLMFFKSVVIILVLFLEGLVTLAVSLILNYGLLVKMPYAPMLQEVTGLPISPGQKVYVYFGLLGIFHFVSLGIELYQIGRKIFLLKRELVDYSIMEVLIILEKYFKDYKENLFNLSEIEIYDIIKKQKFK